MLNRSKFVLKTVEKLVSNRSYSASVATKKEKWDILAGVLVERLPVVTKELLPIEKKVQKMLSDIEFENSLKCDHEIRHEKELIQSELIKRGEIDLDLDADTTKQTAQDFEDACVDELNKFQSQFAPRITEADKKNDFRSLSRKLDESLVFLVKQQLGKDKHLILPQGRWIEGETMRQTAERVLREITGGKLLVSFYGNAPCGFFKYKYPRDSRKESVGAKIFYYRAALRKNQPQILDSKLAFEWRSKIELEKVLKEPYLNSVSQLLI